MTPHQIEIALRLRYTDVEVVGDRFHVDAEPFRVIVVADRETDRLRVMIPIAQVDRDDALTFRRLLEANFATSLDARYAIFNNALWSLYLAPLSSLTTHHFDTAVTQVVELARSTGTNYRATPGALGGGSLQFH